MRTIPPGKENSAMAEILTQNQIDALLKGLDSGQVEMSTDSKPKVKEYDFRSPMKFTKEQLNALSNLHETLGRLLSSYFLGLLRMSCDMEVISIEEQRYYEFNNALPDMSLIGMFRLEPVDKNLDEITMMVDVSPSIGFLIVDRLLGGPGTGYNIVRDFSDIETDILRYVFQRIASNIEEVWRESIDVEATLTSIESNVRLVQAYSPDEIVVIVLMRVKINDLTGNMSFCIPAQSLEEMTTRMNPKFSKTSKRVDEEKENARKQTILKTITDSELELKVTLHETELYVHDIIHLQKDDIIPLNISTDSKVCVKVEELPWFEASIGRTKLKKAIMIDRMI